MLGILLMLHQSCSGYKRSITINMLYFIVPPAFFFLLCDGIADRRFAERTSSGESVVERFILQLYNNNEVIIMWFIVTVFIVILLLAVIAEN